MIKLKSVPTAAMALLGVLAATPAHAADDCETCAKVESGTVKGFREGDVVAFKGIPYASAPVGDLRFQPPRPAKPWSNILETNEYKSSCAQFKDPLEEYSTPARKVTSRTGDEIEIYDNEDCLYLNVWTPKVDSKKRPVMVFIHGGAFVVGSSSSDFYNGKNLASHDAVIVNFNYRLGLFGFMELGELDSAYKGSGNNGLRDQIAAISWVKRNASAFGGDPDNITVFGESAGSASINALMATKRPENLFKRAIAQSGGAQIIHSPKVASQAAKDIFKASDMKTFSEFRDASTQALLEIQTLAYAQSEIGDLLFAPFIDGDIIIGEPNKVIKAGNAKAIDLMAGATQNEMNYWSLYDSEHRNMFTDATDFGDASPLMPEKYRKDLEHRIKGSLDDKYKAILKEADLSKVRQAQNDDFAMIQPMRKMVENQQTNNPNVYLYRFKWAVPDSYIPKGQKNLGSVHAMELPFVFGSLDLAWVPGGVEFSAEPSNEAKELSKQMMAAWTNFARTGNPNDKNVPEWQTYDVSARQTMIWDDQSSSKSDPEPQRRAIWQNEEFTSTEHD
ncbi:carboxylesterase/lipase family protein [Pseudomonas sp. Pf153]|uniref:carboxylesterase/lipase family protein n=1 Tax=Pseudomonas sp. Pf153 TaxID=1699309 RepID=UPI0009E91F8F|nr:carboxylesterase family protein [Pseudomonas sp. Pf153]